MGCESFFMRLPEIFFNYIGRRLTCVFNAYLFSLVLLLETRNVVTTGTTAVKYSRQHMTYVIKSLYFHYTYHANEFMIFLYTFSSNILKTCLFFWQVEINIMEEFFHHASSPATHHALAMLVRAACIA